MGIAVQAETNVERPVLDELVVWIKALNAVGVSPDKAAEIGAEFLLSAIMSGGEDECEEYDEEYDEDEDEA